MDLYPVPTDVSIAAMSDQPIPKSLRDVGGFRGLFEALSRYAVEYVLVGGVAARMHGSHRLTHDVDVMYASSEKNLARLLALCHDLKVKEPPKSKHRRDWCERSLRAAGLELDTALGHLDLLGKLPGKSGRDWTFESLSESSEVGVKDLRLAVRLVDLKTLIVLYKDADRSEDLERIAELETMLERSLG